MSRKIGLVCWCVVVLLASGAESRTISVGYHANLRGWFTAEQFALLDAGRAWAQREWSKCGNITWTGSSRPNVVIKPAYDATAWARAPINGTWIAVSIDEQYRYAWNSEEHWRSLFIHEYGHTLGMNDTRESGHAMTIWGVRSETPSAVECAWMARRYGAPTVPTTLALKGTAAADTLEYADGKLTLNGVIQSVPASIKTITFDGLGGSDTAYLRGGTADVTFTAGRGTATLRDRHTVTTTNVEVNLGYGSGGSGLAVLEDAAGADRLKIEDGFVFMEGEGYYNRAKLFAEVRARFSDAGTLNGMTILPRASVVVISIRGTQVTLWVE